MFGPPWPSMKRRGDPRAPLQCPGAPGSLGSIWPTSVVPIASTFAHEVILVILNMMAKFDLKVTSESPITELSTIHPFSGHFLEYLLIEGTERRSDSTNRFASISSWICDPSRLGFAVARHVIVLGGVANVGHI